MEDKRLTHTMPTFKCNSYNNPTNPTTTSSSPPLFLSHHHNNTTQPCIKLLDDDDEKDKEKEEEEELQGHNGNNNHDEEVVTGREKLKRHREEVKGKVNIPEDWGQEKLLKDWIDCTTFDTLMAPHRLIVSARDALVADGRKSAAARSQAQPFRIHTSC